MMKRQAIADRQHLRPGQTPRRAQACDVDELAESIMKLGQQTPILVRRDGDRFVLVEGLQRLEACKKLGEASIFCYLVDARKH